jgi:hypothetical protein
MNTLLAESSTQTNQRSLVAALAVIREALTRHHLATQTKGETPNDNLSKGTPSISPDESRENIYQSDALQALCASFGLSPFERDVLLLCAGMELDSQFGPLCAAAQGDSAKPFPTWSLALAVLREPHWSALTPLAPLRRWQLIEIGAGVNLTTSQLRIDERVLHFLVGISQRDERLAGILELVHPDTDLIQSHKQIAKNISETLSASARRDGLPTIQVIGGEVSVRRSIAAAACMKLGLNLHRMSAQSLPQNPAELESLARLWEREAALTTSGLLIECDDLDVSDKTREQAVMRFIDLVRGAVFVSSSARLIGGNRSHVHFEILPAEAVEQRHIWEHALGENVKLLNGQLDEITAQFNLSAGAIHSACETALAGTTNGDSSQLSSHLWNVCRVLARPRLDDLAQRIQPKASWDDLVLPESHTATLRQIAMHVRQRNRVYLSWGFAEKCARGLGISALFAGPSGTGKTMAAEVLANALRLDLYRIDLSQVVNKYIGETEKNLRRVFDAAEAGGAILLFDEADALFGKRSDVKDSHDRYSNIEISYLLQRMEAYRGLAILTSNLKNALDQAFLRRIRFVVHFPFPDAADRARIWQRVFPAITPTENLDVNRLARLNVPGGNIRNIALNAAFLAADANEPVRMKHLRRAAQSEYTKLEKPLSDAEIGGWT